MAMMVMMMAMMATMVMMMVMMVMMMALTLLAITSCAVLPAISCDATIISSNFPSPITILKNLKMINLFLRVRDKVGVCKKSDSLNDKDSFGDNEVETPK